MPYVTFDLTTNRTTTPVNSRIVGRCLSIVERTLRYQRYDTLRNVFNSLFPVRSSVILFLQESFTTVPKHGTAATLLYANRELTYTPCLAFSAARTLRAGGETRNALLQRRFRSAISRSTLRVGPDVAPGIKCRYNRVEISRLYLAYDLWTPPPLIAHNCGPQRLRTFSPRRLRLLQLSKVFFLHI